MPSQLGTKMKIECIVSCLVIVEVDAPESTSDAVTEALAKNEFFGNISRLNPDDLSVEILGRAEGFVADTF